MTQRSHQRPAGCTTLQEASRPSTTFGLCCFEQDQRRQFQGGYQNNLLRRRSCTKLFRDSEGAKGETSKCTFRPQNAMRSGTLCSHCCLAVSSAEVSVASKSFPLGSPGGPDSISSQRIGNLLSDPALLERSTDLSNLLLFGGQLWPVMEVIYSRRVTALQKKDGSIRPIAVVSTVAWQPPQRALDCHLRVELARTLLTSCSACISWDTMINKIWESLSEEWESMRAQRGCVGTQLPYLLCTFTT